MGVWEQHKAGFVLVRGATFSISIHEKGKFILIAPGATYSLHLRLWTSPQCQARSPHS